MLRFARLLILGLLVACGGDGVTAPNTIVGTWHLATINSKALPFVFFEVGADKVEVTSGDLTFRDGGTVTETLALRITESGKVTTESASVSGTYTVNGTAVVLVVTQDGETETSTATWSGNTLTLPGTGLTAVFQR